jgi:DNA excision repair protein ERCC-2
MKQDESNINENYWSDIFPFEPYPNQQQGINESINTLNSGGIHLLEGPCGTGKTLISLTACLSLVRDPSTKFERILVTTSKKQQLAAFEDDLKTINNETSEYFNGLTLVGKSDLCPYVQAGEIGSSDIYHRCIELRDNTRQIMTKAVREQKTEREVNVAFGLTARAEAPTDGENNLTLSDEVHTPYQTDIPTAANKEYCPFYAKTITNSVEDEHPISINSVTTSEETLQDGSRCGTCPHKSMKRIHSEATILFGNYKHAFDPPTVAGLTGGIIDDRTLLVCDEAHGLVSEVRDQLSYGISLKTLELGIRNIEQVKLWAGGKASKSKVGMAEKILQYTSVQSHDFTIAANLLKQAKKIIINQIKTGMKDEFGKDWKQACLRENRRELTIPLQNSGEANPDPLSKWVAEKGYEGAWEKLLKIAKLTSVIKDLVARKVENKSPDGSFAIGNVYNLFERWWVGDNTEYFRNIHLTPRDEINRDPPKDQEWKIGFDEEIRVQNNIPQNQIAATLDAFGGTMLMSATLSPIDIYEEVTGVAKLKKGTQPDSSLVTRAISDSDDPDEEYEEGVGKDDVPDLDEIGRTSKSDEHRENKKREVSRSVFELGFPDENRASIAVDAPKFTWSNRSPPRDNPRLRNIYEKAISTVVRTTPENVLICMPSYQEGQWASDILNANPNVDKKILTDQSSSGATTEKLKQDFFSGPPKVLTTSLRGTLTEGVDFDGSKLKGVAICGVPITNTSTESSQAIKDSYDSRFDGQGFDYAFAVPAVRKTRQAIGRVIRGEKDVGVRVLIDSRYANKDGYTSAMKHFPTESADEFISIPPDELPYELQSFWDNQRRR